MILRELLYVAVIPFVAAAAVAFVCRRWRIQPAVIWAAGVGIGIVVGQFGLKGRAGAARAFWSFVGPREAVDWLPHAVLLAIGMTVFATYAPRKWRRLAVALAAILIVALPLRLLAGSVYVTRDWTLIETLIHLALLAATFGLTWVLLAAARESDQPRTRPVLLIVVAAGMAISMALSAGVRNSELCGVAAAALTGTWFVSGARGLSGASGVLTVSLSGLVMLSHFYAQLTPINASLLLVSLVFGGGRLPDVVSTWQPWQQVAIRTGLCLAPLALAVARSFVESQTGVSASPYAI